MSMKVAPAVVCNAGCCTLLSNRCIAVSPGYEDANDAERQAQPAYACHRRRQSIDRQASSTNRNLDRLAGLNVEWLNKARATYPHGRVVFDMDSSESPVHGQREGICKRRESGCCFGPVAPLPNPRRTSTWRHGTLATPYGFRHTRYYNDTSGAY